MTFLNWWITICESTRPVGDTFNELNFFKLFSSLIVYELSCSELFTDSFLSFLVLSYKHLC